MTAPDTASQWERGAQDTGSVENGGIALASIRRVICVIDGEYASGWRACFSDQWHGCHTA